MMRTSKPGRSLFRIGLLLRGNLRLGADHLQCLHVAQAAAEHELGQHLILFRNRAGMHKPPFEQHAARVESAAPLTPDLQADVTGEIKKKYGAGVSISFAQNPALIGGLRIQVGSDLYDGSVKMRLQKLEESF